MDGLRIGYENFKLLPDNFYHQYPVLILGKVEEVVLVALAFKDTNIVSLLKMYLGESLKVYLLDERYIKDKLSELIFLRDSQEQFSENTEIDKSFVSNKVNELITRAIYQGASDIHLEAQENGLLVRYRIDGIIKNIEILEEHLVEAIVNRIKIISGLDISNKRMPQDSRFSFNIFKRKVDIRVSTFPSINGEKIVLRILDKSNFKFTLKSLGLEGRSQVDLESLMLQPYGLILITGPAGSGKTTTLYTLINELKSDSNNIITIEDPVEYILDGIVQSQVKDDIGYSFNEGLRSILRQDPDTIMIGEIRDENVAKLCLRYAITGHLVLSSIHTNDGASTIFRLLSMGLEPYLIASGLIGIISQRLVRGLCEKCREKYYPTSLEKRLIGLDGPIYKARGCELCEDGYTGLFPIMEIINIDDSFRELIIEGRSIVEIKNFIKNLDLKTLKSKASRLLIRGEIGLEDYFKVTLSI